MTAPRPLPLPGQTVRPNTSTAVRNLAHQKQQSLMTRFVVLGLALWFILTIGAALLSDALTSSDHQEDDARRAGLEFDLIARQAQTLASIIAQQATQQGLASVRTNALKLAQGFGEDSNLIAGFGVWPLPNTLDPARERASMTWLHNDGGVFQLREDYNDPRTVPYIHEKWFTPARYSPRDRCYWTPAYQEPLTKREVSTCALPLRTAQGFLGVVTVTLNLDAVAKKLESAGNDDRGYSLLTTLGGDVLAATGTLKSARGEKILRNLADLAREHPQFNPLALQLHTQHEAILRAAAINTDQVNALKNDSRDMSKEEAESALVSLAITAPEGETRPSLQKISISNEGLFSRSSTGFIFSLPGQWWVLTTVTSGNSSIPGLGWISASALALSGGFLAFIFLTLWVLRLWVLQPLRAMTEQIAATASAREGFHELDDSASHELGALAHWHNASLRLLQEQVVQLRSMQTQLSAEHGERRNTQDATLKIKERIAERKTSALQTISDGVIILNEQALIEDMNMAAEKLIGISLRNAVGKPFNEIFKARHQKNMQVTLPNLIELAMRQQGPTEYSQGLRLLNASNTAIDIHLGFYPLQSKQGDNNGCIAVFRPSTVENATQLDTQRRMLDSMTGLPMRGTCEQDLRALIEEARLIPLQHALLFIDVDDLKHINDTKGQQAGDDVIAQIAGMLLSYAHKEGNEAYRLYGDQFAIIMKAVDLATAKTFAEQLCGRFSAAALRGQNSNFRITISVGICGIDGTSPSSSELIRRSDLACTAAKRAGRNCAQEWAPSLEEAKRQADDSVWLKRIRAGLEKDMFHLTTQIMMPMSSKDAPLFQMLMALEDEEGFWSTPSAFLPTAQRHNLMQELDRWLVNCSINQLQQRPEILERINFVNIRLSENVLAENHLLEYLVKSFSENPTISPRKFCFEFTEFALQKNPKQTQTFCEAMRSLGCYLCMDDFLGRRTSDIAQLRKLPIDFIRVDAAQFPNIEFDPIELMSAESLIRLARSLHKNIIAANVDTPSQLKVWQRIGVDYLQGLAVSKPSPVIFSGLN